MLAEVSDHFVRGGDDRLFPLVGAELRGVRLAGVGEDDAPRTVDYRAQAVLAKRAGDVCRGSSLAAVAGDQQWYVRHGVSQPGQFFRIGGADDGTDRSEIAALGRFQRERFDECGDALVEHLSVCRAVLKTRRAWIAGSHE